MSLFVQPSKFEWDDILKLRKAFKEERSRLLAIDKTKGTVTMDVWNDVVNDVTEKLGYPLPQGSDRLVLQHIVKAIKESDARKLWFEHFAAFPT